MNFEIKLLILDFLHFHVDMSGIPFKLRFQWSLKGWNTILKDSQTFWNVNKTVVKLLVILI